MSDVPQCPWEMDVDSHHHIVAEFVLNALVTAFPKSPKKPRPSWIKPTTSYVISCKTAISKSAAAASRSSSRFMMSAVMVCWYASCSRPRNTVLYSFRNSCARAIDSAMGAVAPALLCSPQYEA